MYQATFLKALGIFSIFTLSLNAFAWDGTDSDGNEVTISEGNLVRAGETITIENDGEEKEVTVESITRTGLGVSLELTDDTTGETIEAEMDAD